MAIWRVFMTLKGYRHVVSPCMHDGLSHKVY